MNSTESGSITAFVLGLFSALIVCMALVVDGGNVVSHYLSHADIAENAARFGIQEVTSLRSGDPLLHRNSASRVALNYLERHGVSGTVTVEDNVLTVHVYGRVQFVLLKLIGLSSTTVAVKRSAEPVVQ
jgi:Flp pilus assembly protein TadG